METQDVHLSNVMFDKDCHARRLEVTLSRMAVLLALAGIPEFSASFTCQVKRGGTFEVV
jgi:hypothetical protein